MPRKPKPTKVRDADRSRTAILDAGEALFSERGFDAASLGEVAEAAGVSRGTPSYFFGSKEQLYAAVLERVFAARHDATVRAFAPVHAWCEDPAAPREGLDRALLQATDGYMAFLAARPAFVRLLLREELAGGERLRAAPRGGAAMVDAFEALRAQAPARGIAPFDVAEVVLVHVALSFGPLALDATLARASGRDLAKPAQRRRHARLVVDQVLHLVGGDGS